MRTIQGVAVGLCLLALAGAAAAQTAAKGGLPPAGAARMERFDPEAATEAYLARLSPQQRARSDAYFEGGYWITLWGFLYGLGVYWLLLQSRLSARMRDFAERMTRFGPLRTLLYAVQYIVLTAILFFPFVLYTDFFREHQYGMATQGFPAWLWDQT